MASYRYNALGQRVAKDAAGGSTRFVYDESGHLLGEYDTQGKMIQELVWLDELPVASMRPKSSGVGMDIFYIHPDHLGTPRQITDSNNKIVWQWDNSDPFGAKPANEDPDWDYVRFEFNLRFPGQYYDRETGRHYNYFRDYDPATGRYTTSDPIGLRGGLNRYSYVGSSPLSRTDPRGLIELEFIRDLCLLYVYDDFGEIMFTCKACNNVTSYSKGPWPLGFHDYSHYNRHPESGPTGSYGSHGIFVFDVPQRSGVGVHSGRSGPASKTEGCVRTTDPCMDALNSLSKQTPITTITVH